MVWVRLDDDFADHPKVVAWGDLSTLVGWLHVAALCYCNRFATGGFIPDGQVWRLAKVEQFAPLEKVVECLLTPVPPYKHGLWEKADGGYRVHDYSDYQPDRQSTKDREEHIKQVRSEAGRRGAAKRWQTESLLPCEDVVTEEEIANECQSESQTDGPGPGPGPGPVTGPVTRSRKRDAKDALILARFEHWRATFPDETKRMTLTKDRRGHVSARLDEGVAPETIDLAVTNAADDPWWNGTQDGEWKADLGAICGKRSTVERLAARVRRPAVARNVAAAMRLVKETEHGQA